MSLHTGKVENAIWQMPKFYFKVTWGSATIIFSEISGLDTEAQIIEYRHGDSKAHPSIKVPGMQKVGNVTMKRGVFAGDTTYHNWFKQIKLNSIITGRQTITIQLIDENGKPTMSWVLNNAWPTKITGTDLSFLPIVHSPPGIFVILSALSLLA